LGTAQVVTQVRHRVTCSGKDPGSNSGKELGIVSDKDPATRLGKNSSKEAGQDKMCRTRRFLCFGVNMS
jgi:hypothetical protein